MSPSKKAVIILSGGLDSTVTLAAGLEYYDVVLALTFNYGQRAFGKEIKASRLIAEHYGIPHEIIPLPWLSALLPDMMKPSTNKKLAWHAKNPQQDNFFEAQPVWVPNRNGVFLNIAAAYAEALNAQVILFGANAEEAERFPDNTSAFRVALNQVFQYATLTHPQVEAPLEDLMKPEIIAKAKALNAPLHLIWSCYGDGALQCGVCPSCVRLKTALTQSQAGAFFEHKIAFMP